MDDMIRIRALASHLGLDVADFVVDPDMTYVYYTAVGIGSTYRVLTREEANNWFKDAVETHVPAMMGTMPPAMRLFFRDAEYRTSLLKACDRGAFLAKDDGIERKVIANLPDGEERTFFIYRIASHQSG